MEIRKCRNTWQCCDGECAKCETSATNYTVSDYISRQAAIDAIRASTSKYTGLMEMEMYTDDDAVEAINGVPSAQQWIPCSERLPEENEMVLISAKYIGHLSHYAPYVEEGFFTRAGWYSAYGDNYSELLAKVVAWMPLPEQYKGE